MEDVNNEIVEFTNLALQLNDSNHHSQIATISTQLYDIEKWLTANPAAKRKRSPRMRSPKELGRALKKQARQMGGAVRSYDSLASDILSTLLTASEFHGRLYIPLLLANLFRPLNVRMSPTPMSQMIRSDEVIQVIQVIPVIPVIPRPPNTVLVPFHRINIFDAPLALSIESIEANGVVVDRTRYILIKWLEMLSSSQVATIRPARANSPQKRENRGRRARSANSLGPASPDADFEGLRLPRSTGGDESCNKKLKNKSTLKDKNKETASIAK